MTAHPMETTTGIITGSDLLAMGDIGPCELIDGVIVKMSPAGGLHGFIELRLALLVGGFIRDRNVGFCMVGEVGIDIRRDPDWIRGADLAFWSHAKLPDGPPAGFVEVAPDLVVEILSPTDRWPDVHQKIDDYLAIGVDTLWIVDPEEETVFVYRSAAQRTALRSGDTLAGTGPLTGFTLPVSELCAI
ncbi:MAG: Uma2 family endonuclease [Caldilineaceae bacterium]|nr:Uma2 family endonuclease [Caldilineaceae bacterium]